MWSMRHTNPFIIILFMGAMSASCLPEAAPLSSIDPEDMRDEDAGPDLFVGPIDQPDSGPGPGSCAMGARECVDGQSFRTCVSAEDGSTVWSESGACEEGVCAGAGECCQMPCTPGEKLCTEAGVQTCIQDAGQCPRLSAPVACPNNQICDETGACVAQCRSECTLGEKLCFPEGSPAYRECAAVAGQASCNKYEANERMCGAGQLCTQGKCVSQCNHGCPTAGAKRCASGGEQVCKADAQGCRAWAGTGGRCCNSATLGRDVVQGTCVQVNYAACNVASCAWATCSNGTWNYCINANTCPGDAKFGHASCR